MITRIIRNLEIVKDDLSRFCHQDDCQNISYCPNRCCGRNDLGLDTSMAWQLRRTIRALIHWHESSVLDKDDIFKARTKIDYLWDVVLRHPDKFSDLEALITRTMNLLTTLRIHIESKGD